MILGISLNAQFDDLYYIEDDNDVSIDYSTEDTTYDSADYSDYDNADYNDYNYYSEYDNYYASRIRRFSRPVGSSYYNSYYSNSIINDPFLSYYTPSYVVFDRLSRGYIRTNNRVGRGFVSYATSPFGFYGQTSVFGNPYIGTTRFIGVRPSFGGLATRGGGYGCPVGAPIATNVQPRVINPRTSTRGAYNGTRRASATRTTTGYRGTARSNSRTGVRSTTAPRTRRTTRTSSSRPSIGTSRSSSTRSARSSSGSRSTFKRSGSSSRSSFKSSSPSRSSFRSSGSSRSSRRGR